MKYGVVENVYRSSHNLNATAYVNAVVGRVPATVSCVVVMHPASTCPVDGAGGITFCGCLCICAYVHALVETFPPSCSRLVVLVMLQKTALDAVGWATGRASGL